MKKRGVSAVIATLVIILLTLIAVGILWVVIKTLITQNTEDVTTSRYTVDLRIQNVVIGNNQVNVTVKRNAGAGELSGINFVIFDGTNSNVTKQSTNIAELATSTFPLNYNGFVRSVSINPIFKLGSKNISGTESDKITYTGLQAIKNMHIESKT